MIKDKVRQFDTGATRSQDASRIDPEAYLSPIVIERYCEYLSKHRTQPDGSTRDPDNWQKGIPLPAYMKGLWRHMLHLWTRHRGFSVRDPAAAESIEEDLCAMIFNAQGYLFEVLKGKRTRKEVPGDKDNPDFRWTKTPPAETGWYRHKTRVDPAAKGSIVSVSYFESRNSMCAIAAGHPVPVCEIGGFWSGPHRFDAVKGDMGSPEGLVSSIHGIGK